MVSSLGLCDQTLLALDDGGDGFFDFPLANITEGLATDGGLLGGF